jgi:hypothetical protein
MITILTTISSIISKKIPKLIINNENILLNPNGWVNNQHLATTIQILYV